MASDVGNLPLEGRDLDLPMAVRVPSHYYISEGQQRGLVEHPQRFAIALTTGSSSTTELELLGLSFVRKLNADFSVYDLVYQNESQVEGSWRDSSLIRETAPVFVALQSNSEAVVLDELIVSLADGISAEAFFQGNSHFRSYRSLPGTSDQFIATVAAGKGEVALTVANLLHNDSRLAWVEPNFYQDWQKFFTPNDTRFSNQWHLNNTGQSGGTVDADSDLPEAWDVLQGGSVDYTIGIIDDGVVTNHPDLTVWVNPGEVSGDGLDNDANGWVDDVNGWNFVSNNNQSSNTSTSDMHGTSVAGVAAAKGNNSLGVAGASYGSKVLSARIFEGNSVASDANIASALYYAAGRKANGSGTWKSADVLNNSWGGGASSTVINNALTWGTTLGRQGKGTPIFVASGNEFGAVSEPALQSLNIPGVFAVGAINNKAEKSDYSNFGAAVDLVTPSNDTRSGYLAIDTTDRPGTAGYDPSDYTGTGANGFGGTSSATPLASGIAALVFARADQLGVTLTPAQLRSYLRSNTDIVGSSAYSITTGRNNNMGWGRLNAASGVSNLNNAEISVLSTTAEFFTGGNSVNFGSAQLGATVDVTLRVRNQGTTSLNLTSLTVGSGPFLVQSGFGSSTLALGAATTFTIRFQPTAEGVANGTITIGSNDTDEALFTINLTGTGTATGGGTGGGVLLAWDVNGQSAFGAQGLSASGVASGVSNSLGLTRGSGVATTNSAAADAWGGHGWASTSSAGVTGSQFVSFGLTVSAGQTASLSSLDLNYRRSGTGAGNGSWQYQINTGSWTDIGDFANEFSSSASAGAAMTQLSLAGISGLQNLAAGTSVNLRVVPYGATATGGSWYVYDLSGDDLIVSGSVQAASGTNSAPTDITLTASSIAENAGASATIGTLSSTDSNAGNTFTYSLVTGSGSTDNLAFAVTGNLLKANASFDFETKNSYSIGVRTTDQGGLFFEKAFTINVTNVNEAPTDVALSSSLVANNAPAGTTVGTLSTTDVDAANTFTYALSGTDAGKFSIVSNALRVGSTVLDGVQSSYSISITSADQGGLSITKSFTIIVTPGLLSVSSFAQSNSGFSVRFGKAFDPALLNLVDSNGVYGASDFNVVGVASGSVAGSVVVDADNRGFTFIKTGGMFAADTYTVTLRSAANGFVDLDGDSNGTTGDNYVRQFTVGAIANDTIIVSVGDFVRGFGQAVNLPASSTSGIPITLNTGVNVAGASFTLKYDPALLSISGGTTPIAGASISVNTDIPGTVRVAIAKDTEFSSVAGPITLVNLIATVPTTAPSGVKSILDLSDVTVSAFDTTDLPNVADDGIQIASFRGDINNSQSITTGDVTGLLRSISGSLGTTGFSNLKLADPALVGDMNDSGSITTGDVTGLLRFITSGSNGFSSIPPLPTGFTPPATGPDPIIYIPTNLTVEPSNSVVVPVNILVTEPTGISFAGLNVAFTYDATRFTIGSIELGAALSGFGFSPISNIATPGLVKLVYTSGLGPEFAYGFAGTLVNVTMNAIASAASGVSAINIISSAASDNNTNDLVIWPPALPGADSNDGLVNVLKVYSEPTGFSLSPEVIPFVSGPTKSILASLELEQADDSNVIFDSLLASASLWNHFPLLNSTSSGQGSAINMDGGLRIASRSNSILFATNDRDVSAWTSTIVLKGMLLDRFYQAIGAHLDHDDFPNFERTDQNLSVVLVDFIDTDVFSGYCISSIINDFRDEL